MLLPPSPANLRDDTQAGVGGFLLRGSLQHTARSDFTSQTGSYQPVTKHITETPVCGGSHEKHSPPPAQVGLATISASQSRAASHERSDANVGLATISSVRSRAVSHNPDVDFFDNASASCVHSESADPLKKLEDRVATQYAKLSTAISGSFREVSTVCIQLVGQYEGMTAQMQQLATLMTGETPVAAGLRSDPATRNLKGLAAFPDSASPPRSDTLALFSQLEAWQSVLEGQFAAQERTLRELVDVVEQALGERKKKNREGAVHHVPSSASTVEVVRPHPVIWQSENTQSPLGNTLEKVFAASCPQRQKLSTHQEQSRTSFEESPFFPLPTRPSEATIGSVERPQRQSSSSTRKSVGVLSMMSNAWETVESMFGSRSPRKRSTQNGHAPHRRKQLDVKGAVSKSLSNHVGQSRGSTPEQSRGSELEGRRRSMNVSNIQHSTKMTLNVTSMGGMHSFADLVFSDSEADAERRHSQAWGSSFSPSNFVWKQDNWATGVLTSSRYRSLTYLVIVLNSMYNGFEMDDPYSGRKVALSKSHWAYMVMSNLFCTFYVVEFVMRCIAYESKVYVIKKFSHFVDTLLMLMLVLDTWIVELVLIISSGNKDFEKLAEQMHTIFHVCYLVRFARIINAVPELRSLSRGVFMATKAVFWTLVMVVGLTYCFGILMNILLKDETKINELMGDRHFAKLADSMWTLVVDGALLEEFGVRMTILLYNWSWKTSLACVALSLYMFVAALTLLNMLIGVMSKIVNSTSKSEKDEKAIWLMKETILKQLYKFDDGDGLITKTELELVFNDEECGKVLTKLNVDRLFFLELQAMLFPNEDSQVTVSTIVELMLLCRGDNVTTVRALASGLLYVTSEIHRLERILCSGRLEFAQSVIPSRTLTSGCKSSDTPFSDFPLRYASTPACAAHSVGSPNKTT